MLGDCVAEKCQDIQLAGGLDDLSLINTLRILSSWRSLSWTVWRNRFCWSRFSISHLEGHSEAKFLS